MPITINVMQENYYNDRNVAKKIKLNVQIKSTWLFLACIKSTTA